jgi:hypothetical protein
VTFGATRPEIFDRIGTAEFEWNRVIDLVVAGIVRCDPVLFINFSLHFRRNVPDLFGGAGYAEILNRDCKRVSRRQRRIWNDWRGLLGRGGEWGQKQKRGSIRSERALMVSLVHWSRRSLAAIAFRGHDGKTSGPDLLADRSTCC